MAATATAALPPNPRGLVDPAALMRIRSLELRAKVVVEGLWRGLHRSPFHGFSVEFTEHRRYVPGDDVRFVDWRLLARTDREYIKKYEDETNLRCHLVVDESRSMAFGSTGHSKADYAATLAATLAHVLCGQGDAVGLVTFATTLGEVLPPRNRPGHLRRLLHALERAPSGTGTDPGRALGEVAARLHRRGLVVLLSDLLAPVDSLDRPLGALRAAGHEVVVFQILDPAERALAIEGDRPALLRDLESGRAMFVDPATARAGYQRALEQHLASLRAITAARGIEHHVLGTSQPLERALLAFLGDRGRAGVRR